MSEMSDSQTKREQLTECINKTLSCSCRHLVEEPSQGLGVWGLGRVGDVIKKKGEEDSLIIETWCFILIALLFI